MKGEAVACVVLALVLSLTGCLDSFLDSDEENTASKAVKRHLDSMINEDADAFCNSFVKAEGNRYSTSEFEECLKDFRKQEIEDPYDVTWMFEYEIIDVVTESFFENVTYSPELVEIAKVNVSRLQCSRDSAEDLWECGDWGNTKVHAGKMSNGGWLVLYDYYDAYPGFFAILTGGAAGSIYPISVFRVSEEGKPLEDFTYVLKDSFGVTTEFGEIAMQNLSGNVVGIDIYYGDKCGDVCDGDLLTRAAAVDDDDGSTYTLKFYDQDQDGNLSSGDKFTVRGQGSGRDGPAKEDWSICVKYDLTGHIVGCRKLSNG